jgi:muramoyltetrapeptide carboxypeptidase
MPNPLVPRPLLVNGTIGVISPAGCSDPEAMTTGVNLLKSWGYQVKVMPNALNRWGYLAGTDQERLADLVAAFTDPDVDLVLAARGGFGCTRLLPHIPWDILAKHPKLLVGFSDLTALLVPFYDRLGWVGLHGPMLTSNLIELEPFTKAELIRVWSGDFLANPMQLVSQQPLQWLHGHTMQGLLTGGNLSLLAALCGTPWQPQTEGHIVFIEDWKEAYYSIDRQYQQLKQAGLLTNIAGLLLGDFSDIRADAAWSIAEHWQQLTQDLGIPVAFGVPAGHGDCNTTLAIGQHYHV